MNTMTNDEGNSMDHSISGIQIHDAINEMYNVTSYTINVHPCYEMDNLLHTLNTPANQSLYVIYHTIHQTILRHHYDQEQQQEHQQEETEHQEASFFINELSEALQLHCDHLLKTGHAFIVNTNFDITAVDNNDYESTKVEHNMTAQSKLLR